MYEAFDNYPYWFKNSNVKKHRERFVKPLLFLT